MPRASNVVDVNETIVVEAVPHDENSGTEFVAADIAAIANENEVMLGSLDDAIRSDSG
jgi:hypothetical protein